MNLLFSSYFYCLDCLLPNCVYFSSEFDYNSECLLPLLAILGSTLPLDGSNFACESLESYFI